MTRRKHTGYNNNQHNDTQEKDIWYDRTQNINTDQKNIQNNDNKQTDTNWTKQHSALWN
jgi:hypothetical protein